MIESKYIKLGGKTISSKSKPYIIAEIGVNHGGSIDLAFKLIDQAKKGGADAVKFQSYKADTLASKKSPAYWDTSKETTLSQHQLFKKYDNFNAVDYELLSKYCDECDIEFLSTPFDDDAIEFLNPLVSFFKIASADITNLPFLKKIASKGKPIIISTGASSLAEIDTSLNTIIGAGCKDIVLMHCILNYPTINANAHLAMINGLKRAYPDLLIGYSDHTLPDEFMTSLTVAHLLGAVIIEKHFTHDKNLPGNDHYHAMNEDDLFRFRTISNNIHELLGKTDFKRPIETEQLSRLNARRSIVLNKDVPKKHILKEEDITYKRPGTGISPLHWDEVIGSTTNRKLKEDTILSWNDLNKII
tara:strand:+ start:1730 stop:2806 length:1077 start_codon:yes stop_codon:yes gene_type:complete